MVVVNTVAGLSALAANALGLYDMHGNVVEWTANWYAKDTLLAYAKGDIKGPVKGKGRVVRGGSWDENIPNLRSSFRNVKPPIVVTLFSAQLIFVVQRT